MLVKGIKIVYKIYLELRNKLTNPRIRDFDDTRSLKMEIHLENVFALARVSEYRMKPQLFGQRLTDLIDTKIKNQNKF